jgi:hypothetical protein
MLLIYTQQSTIRLQYIFKFVFEEILGTSYSLTIDEATFIKDDGNKLNYSNHQIENVFQIEPHNILFENDIKERVIKCFDYKNTKAFFKTENADFPFDIFAACFYLISRYEEYLPHTKDVYGRYAHENSLAFKEGFLQQPAINIWLKHFKQTLAEHFPSMVFKPKAYSYLPTYDIDMAWAYKEKGFIRNTGGFIKNPSIGRITALLGLSDDPFNCYDDLDLLHENNSLQPIYFFLVAKENGEYDKNILPDNEAMQNLIKSHAAKYEIGIHPSWKSFVGEQILKDEINVLENIIDKKIETSRQHYIKFTLPESYNRLISQNICNDYSMGYGTVNGFRASTGSSFLWFDLMQNKITKLRVHPFCFMDANSHYEQKQTVIEAEKELMYYHQICKQYQTMYVTIFHNSILGTQKEFEGWSKMYEKFINTISAAI